PLPYLPQRIGVITSPDGAALHDFLHMASARFSGVPIEIYPVRVQGDGAAAEIVEALDLCNTRAAVDVIVLCRGGGSIEDLWAFNEEVVARGIFASRIPVVAAIGHEVDYTIADFVADYRAPTPTAAAEAVMPECVALTERALELRGRLVASMDRILAGRRQEIDFLRRTMTDPSALLARQLHGLDQRQHLLLQSFQNMLRMGRARLDGVTMRLLEQNPRKKLLLQKQWVAELGRKAAVLTAMHLERKSARMQRVAALLDAVSPLAVLGRGYAIARKLPGGEVVREDTQVERGDDLEILLRKGILICEVTDKRSGSS
ncbi:MAG: exodeoxyribonuclease VII large subunit, partial [Desulfobulbaceae bacterium]|nr:exodeoxyribonuclease VII large subunit [Desulfobulbaceae bacterium]